MKKRLLCTICLIFLIMQTVRICVSETGHKGSSCLEYGEEKGYTTLTGVIKKIENKTNVTAVYLYDTPVMAYVRQQQQEQQLKIGNTVRIWGETESFEPARNPGNFDQRAYYRRQGIYALMWTEGIEVLSQETYVVRQLLAEIRSAWSELLIRNLGEYYGGTMCAVLLGEKSGLDEEMKKLYQKNGIGHLLAISGLHMSFIGLGIYGGLRRTGVGFVPAGIMGGSLLLFYTLMIGAGVSSTRALIMFLVRIGADMSGRDYDMPTGLSLAAAILVWRQPLWLTDAGFQLSFGAVLGIFLLNPVFSEMLGCTKSMEKAKGTARRFFRKILVGLSASLAVTVFVMGPVLFFYFELPLYSAVLNLLVIPVMPVAMGAGLIGSAIAYIWEPAGSLVLYICRAVLWIYDQMCSLLSGLPGSRFVTGRPCMSWIIVYYLLLCVLYTVFRVAVKKREKDAGRKNVVCRYIVRGTGISMIILAAVMTIMCKKMQTNPGEATITVLDVGQGDCVHIRTSSYCFLVDGGSSDVTDVGKYRIEPFLLSVGDECLDYVFVTHGDEDHINGIFELLNDQKLGIKIRNLVLPPEEYHDEKITKLVNAALRNGTRVVIMEKGQRLSLDGIKITCMGPRNNSGTGPGNAASLVLGLEYGNFDMLLTGDVEASGEEELIESGQLKQYEVLKAAHHGSKNSGTEEFLEIVKPYAAVISAGKGNRYGHPHRETMERLQERGCRIYSTCERGAVTIVTDGNKMYLQSFLDETLVKT